MAETGARCHLTGMSVIEYIHQEIDQAGITESRLLRFLRSKSFFFFFESSEWVVLFSQTRIVSNEYHLLRLSFITYNYYFNIKKNVKSSIVEIGYI